LGAKRERGILGQDGSVRRKTKRQLTTEKGKKGRKGKEGLGYENSPTRRKGVKGEIYEVGLNGLEGGGFEKRGRPTKKNERRFVQKGKGRTNEKFRYSSNGISGGFKLMEGRGGNANGENLRVKLFMYTEVPK